MFGFFRFVFRKIKSILLPPPCLKSLEGKKHREQCETAIASPSQKILLIGGLTLLLVAMIYGGILGALFLEKINDMESELTIKSLFSVSQDDFYLAKKYQEEFLKVSALHAALRSAHSHLGSFAIIMLAIASNLKKIKLNEKWKRASAIVFVSAAPLFSGGIILQPLVNKSLGKIVSILSGAAIIASIAIFLLGAVRWARTRPTGTTHK